MSCRRWLSSAARHCQSGLSQQRPRALSTSAPLAIPRHIFPESKTKRSRADPSQVLLGHVNEGLDRGGPPSPEGERALLEQHKEKASVKDLRNNATTENYLRQMPRRWRLGDVYSPRDLGPAEMTKWRTPRPPKKDIIDMLGFNPLDNYKNFSLISDFMTPMGRIKHSESTGLRPVNQRKMAKAIRRAIGMGLHPSVHRHPEILRWSRQRMGASATPMSSHPSQTYV